MTFFAPHQVVPTEIRDDWALEGRWLIIHPDFLNGVPSARDIRQYNFFSYELHEALYLSEEEEQVITSLLADITRESQLVTDAFSHRIIIKLIELLLSYCDRFYHRQFLTRRQAENQHLVHFEQLLDDYLDRSDKEYIGIPSVSFFAEKLRLSANYLSDMLRSTTGQSATNTFSRS